LCRVFFLRGRNCTSGRVALMLMVPHYVTHCETRAPWLCNLVIV
jgi:hypothetical protein